LNRREFLGRAAVLGVTAAATTALSGSTAAGEDEDLFLLGLEEHFATAELQGLNGIQFPKGVPRFDINDGGGGRIADMDAAGINIQVLSALTPGARTCLVSHTPASSTHGSPTRSFRPIRIASAPLPRCR